MLQGQNGRCSWKLSLASRWLRCKIVFRPAGNSCLWKGQVPRRGDGTPTHEYREEQGDDVSLTLRMRCDELAPKAGNTSLIQ